MHTLCKPRTLQHSSIGSLCLHLDIFGLTDVCSNLLMAALPTACLHAYELMVGCLTSHQPYPNILLLWIYLAALLFLNQALPLPVFWNFNFG